MAASNGARNIGEFKCNSTIEVPSYVQQANKVTDRRVIKNYCLVYFIFFLFSLSRGGD